MKRTGIFCAAALLAGVALTAVVRAGGDLVVFPENYAKGVLYTTVDRADNKQYRELYSTPAAIEAVKAGKPIPSGTVLTLVQYKAKLDAAGQPEKDADGRFIKGDLIGYTVMEKRTGWGGEYADDVPQRRVGVPGLQGGQDGQRQGGAEELLHLPQAARQAGLCVLLRQDEGREVRVEPDPSGSGNPRSSDSMRCRHIASPAGGVRQPSTPRPGCQSTSG